MADFEPPQLPPIADAPISVVLTAIDAGDDVSEVLDAWRKMLDDLKREHEILLVHDGGVRDPADKPKNVRLLKPKGGHGVGAALATGIKTARHPLLCYAPCDRRYDPADLKKLLAVIDAVHVVSAIRGGREAPAVLRWLGWLQRWTIRILFGVELEPLPMWRGWRHRAYHWLLRWLFGLRVHDVPSALKLFRRDLLARLPIQSDGPFVHVEILAKANFLGCYMDEVVVSYPADAIEDPLRPMLPDARRVLFEPAFGKP